MQPCERPDMPEGLMFGNSLSDYAVSATRYIIDLEEKFDACDGKIAAIGDFFGKAGGQR